MGRVRALDRRVYERIAAGEVIERPANVVKELVENALDAGASRVSVEIKGGGIDLIRVRDDGTGMDREDALLSIDRYTTSKLERLDDLDGLATLGFRGEALASIAAVSKMELATRVEGSEAGVRLSVQGGELLSVDDVGGTVGTAVEVRDLFYNVPARRRFMKGPAAEGSRIIDVVQRLAATRLDVHFILVVAGREALNSAPTGSLQDRAVELWGRDTARHLIELPATGEGARIRVTGVVGKPQLAKPNRGQLFVSVNGRPVDSPEVAEAVRDAYGELLFRGRWPVAIVDVAVAGDRVDVNVHPAKREVLFREPLVVKEAVEVAVREALAAADVTTDARLPRRERAMGVGPGAPPSGPDERRAEGPAPASVQLDLGGDALEEDRLALAMEARPIVDEELGWEDLGSVPPWLLSLRPIGQVMDTYIVCEGEDALYLVDQHALAERLTYESIKASAAHRRLKQQELLEPIELRPTEEQLPRLEGARAVLESLGFSFVVTEGGTVSVTALPSMLGQRFTGDDVDMLMQDILSGEGSGTAATKEAAIRSMACHLSLRAGHRLSPKQVVGLLRGMAGSRDPLACVHGRPTVIRIGRSELERMFRRTE